MPCAAGELCLHPEGTPVAPHGHACQGGCGGRLHGTCGSVTEDDESHRICTACVHATDKRKRAAGEGGGAGKAKRPDQGEGKGGPRKRLPLDQKLEILKLLEQRVTQEQIADRYECSVRLVRLVKANKADVVEALRQDTVDQMTAQLAGTFIEVEDDDEDDEDGDDTTGPGERDPPAYGELSSHVGVLEKAAAQSENGEAGLLLAKARMSMIAAHAAKPSRQADLREFI